MAASHQLGNFFLFFLFSVFCISAFDLNCGRVSDWSLALFDVGQWRAGGGIGSNPTGKLDFAPLEWNRLI